MNFQNLTETGIVYVGMITFYFMSKSEHIS